MWPSTPGRRAGAGASSSSYAAIPPPSPTRRTRPATCEIPFAAGAPRNVDLVVSILDDVRYLYDSDRLVVVDVTLAEGADGNLAGRFLVAPIDDTQSMPTATTGGLHSDVQFDADGPAWRGHLVVDA